MMAFFMAGIGRWLAGGVIGVLLIGGLYIKGRSDGSVACQLTQRKQMDRMETYVKQIRERVEHRLPDDVDSIMRPDTWQREQ